LKNIVESGIKHHKTPIFLNKKHTVAFSVG